MLHAIEYIPDSTFQRLSERHFLVALTFEPGTSPSPQLGNSFLLMAELPEGAAGTGRAEAAPAYPPCATRGPRQERDPGKQLSQQYYTNKFS